MSIVPSKFKSISENCPALIPPEKAELKAIPFSDIIRLVSLFKIICENEEVKQKTKKRRRIFFKVIK
jgi:hypothetical protein|tara:strand:+ start:735 stop:935 length:201 start_codon:yes stop_codon:yes gene_type:complete